MIGFKKFSLAEMEAATNDFSEENILGRGGSAVIYKVLRILGLLILFWTSQLDYHRHRWVDLH